MRKLRDVVYKSKNLIIQQVQKGVFFGVAVVVGSGHSISLDDNDNISFSDPGYNPPKKLKGYGDYCSIFAVYYPKTCEGLAIAGNELAKFINDHFRLCKKIILHGHSKCGCCFQNLAQWLDSHIAFKTYIVSVSAPLKGTPFADLSLFMQQLNGFEELIYLRIFSNHKVDQDLIPGSDFLHNLNLQSSDNLHRIYIIAKCGVSLNPIDWILYFIDIRTSIHGDGIIPLKSQIPDCTYQKITASHCTSMRKSLRFVRDIIRS